MAGAGFTWSVVLRAGPTRTARALRLRGAVARGCVLWAGLPSWPPRGAPARCCGPRGRTNSGASAAAGLALPGGSQAAAAETPASARISPPSWSSSWCRPRSSGFMWPGGPPCVGHAAQPEAWGRGDRRRAVDTRGSPPDRRLPVLQLGHLATHAELRPEAFLHRSHTCPQPTHLHPQE